MKAKIYAVETTNYCNARCTWCPHRQMKRPLGFASFDTIEKVYDYCRKINQEYIALHHMGEPLLHPYIGNIIKLFSYGKIQTEFSTNGILLSKHGGDVLESGLTRLRIAVDYAYTQSGYIDRIKKFLELSRNYKTEIRIHTIIGNDLKPFEGFNAVLENKSFDNWAGAIDGKSTLAPSNKCYFKEYNYVVVLWDGRIVPCCMDYDGVNIIGNIDGIGKIVKNKTVPLCKGCANLQFAEAGGWKQE